MHGITLTMTLFIIITLSGVTHMRMVSFLSLVTLKVFSAYHQGVFLATVASGLLIRDIKTFYLCNFYSESLYFYRTTLRLHPLFKVLFN